MTADLRIVPTADLDAGERLALRRFLDLSYAGEYDDHDWDHAQGGLHVLVEDGGGIVAHASLVQRRVLHRDRSLRAGYVESVAVSPHRRRAGLGGLVMAQVERLIDGGYALGALSASSIGRPLYLRRGWLPWEGPLAVVGPEGIRRLPEGEDDVLVRVVPGGADLPLTDQLAVEYRDGAVW